MESYLLPPPTEHAAKRVPSAATGTLLAREMVDSAIFTSHAMRIDDSSVSGENAVLDCSR
jgi:hypothetical protein